MHPVGGAAASRIKKHAGNDFGWNTLIDHDLDASANVDQHGCGQPLVYRAVEPSVGTITLKNCTPKESKETTAGESQSACDAVHALRHGGTGGKAAQRLATISDLAA